MTVYHTVNDNSLNTGVVVDFDECKGTILKPLDIGPPILKGNLFSRKIDEIDLAYKKMDEMPPCQFFIIDELGEVKCRKNRVILDTTLTDVPISSENYGFAGFICGNTINNPIVGARFSKILNQQLAYYDGLQYEYKDDDYYVFSLPNKDYEYEDFEGTSGAPILSSDGKLVSLVACGWPSKDGTKWFIKGIILAKYKVIIDIECDLL